MAKHHLEMVVSFLLASCLTACGGGAVGSLPSTRTTLPNAASTAAIQTSSVRTLSSSSTSKPSYFAIDAGGPASGSFGADKDYSGGSVAVVTSAINTSAVTDPAPQSVYQSQRYAPTLTYTIPSLAPNAAHTLRLHFVESYFSAAGQRVFNISINGTQVLANFDIFKAAGGQNIAIVKEFGTYSDSSGKIKVTLTATVNDASIAGIELIGGLPSATPAPSPTPVPATTMSINVGGAANGTWIADTDYNGGTVATSTGAVNTSLTSNAAPAAVYQTQRYAANLGYAIPSLTPNAAYTVRLHFAETYFTSAGQRVFSATINGAQVLSNLDIFKAAGGANIALVKQFTTTADSSGKISIALTSSVNYATIAGIEIISGSLVSSAPPTPTPAPLPSSTPAPVPTTPSSSTTYPSAGWLPFTTNGPMIQTVASVYGPTPLTSCKFQTTYAGIQGTGCLNKKSAAVIANMSSNTSGHIGFIDTFIGSSDQATAIFNSSHTYSGLNNSSTTPFFVAHGTTTGSLPETFTKIKTGCQYGGPGGSLWIPQGAVPELNTDRHIAVRDMTTGLDWIFIGTGLPSASNIAANAGYLPVGTTNTCNTGGQMVSMSDPTSPFATSNSSYATSQGLNNNSTAGGMSTLWEIRPEDVLAGRIPHALIFSLNCNTTANGSTSIKYYPAHNADNNFFCGAGFGSGGVSNNVDYGGHIWSDKAPDPALRGTRGCDILSYAILRELNEFGAYANDDGTNNGFVIDAASDLDDTYTGNPNGTHSYWTDVLTSVTSTNGGSFSQGSRYQFQPPVGACGVTWSNMHYLVPPTTV